MCTFNLQGCGEGDNRSSPVITSHREDFILGSDEIVQIGKYVVTVGGRNPRENAACQVPIHGWQHHHECVDESHVPPHVKPALRCVIFKISCLLLASHRVSGDTSHSLVLLLLPLLSKIQDMKNNKELRKLKHYFS